MTIFVHVDMTGLVLNLLNSEQIVEGVSIIFSMKWKADIAAISFLSH